MSIGFNNDIGKPNILLLGLLVISLLYAGDKKYFILDDMIGLSLDKDENKQLKIFPEDGFLLAKFININDSLYAIIYFENANDSLIIYINPYQKYLIKSRIKDYKAGVMSETNKIIDCGLPVYDCGVFNIKVNDPINVLKFSGAELTGLFHSVSPTYLRIYSRDEIKRIALKEIKEIVYFNKDIEYKRFRVYFYMTHSLAGAFMFDRLGKIKGYPLSSKWIYRSAGFALGFYCGFRLYRIIDRNFIKKVTYYNVGVKFEKREAWLKKKLDFFIEKLRIGKKVNIY